MEARYSFTVSWCNKHKNWWITNCPDCMVDSNEAEIKKAGRKEVVEFVDDLIIGIDNCKFEERLDGDKGCIVLDMNENQWQAQKKKWGIK